MVKIEEITIPSAHLGKLNPLADLFYAQYRTEPIADNDGNVPTMLPYLMQDGYDRAEDPTVYRAAVVENDHIRAEFIPALGGRLRSLYDKDKGRELLYKNPVFRPGNLALRNAWFSGGVEFNLGIRGHTPMTCSPMHVTIDKSADGDILRLYEYERIRGVMYSVSAWVSEDSPVLYLRVRIENRTDKTKPMYWWSNLAVPETKGTRVVVPAHESFLYRYKTDRYVLETTPVPMNDGVDVSYPVNIGSSRDFFYKIPESSRKWITAFDADGKGLLQCSTNRLYGRKLFVWGQGRGGRRWNEWLSVKDSAYVEIQAGLAPTQLDYVDMPAHTVWEWTEAYTAFDCPPEVMHGDFDSAIATAEQYMYERVGDPEKLSFPADSQVTTSERVYYGSGWGALEEKVRGERISETLEFPRIDNSETTPWYELLEKNSFPCPDPSVEPASYVIDKFWLDKLKALPEQNWFSQLHIGVITCALAAYGKADVADAKAAFEESLRLMPNAWAMYNLAMLYRNQYKDADKARELILGALKLAPGCAALAVDAAKLLCAGGHDKEWLDVYSTLPDEVKETGRVRLHTAIALKNLERYEEAARIVNADFVLPDVREGEVSLSELWFTIHRHLYAKENNLTYSDDDKELAKAADEKYPLPREIDFRMSV